MNIAITGATGFIGRHVLAQLERSGEHAITIAVHSAPYELPINPETTSITRLDINEDVENVYQQLGEPDLLIHLAWEGLSDYLSEVHIKRTLPNHYSFIAKMVEGGVKSVVVSGTCLEYGMQSKMLDESMPCMPVTAYGSAKNQLRQQLSQLQGQYEFKLTWMRLFYVDGDNPQRPTLFNVLKRAVEKGESSFNMSGGEQLRDFIPINDLAVMIGELALKMLDIGVVNICSGMPVSVKEYVEHKIKENNWTMTLNLGHYPYPEYEPMAFWGSTKKLNQQLKYNLSSSFGV